MGKKNTLKCHKFPTPKLKEYDIAIRSPDGIDRTSVAATRVDTSDGNLRLYYKDDLIGEFRDWVYYVRIDDLDDECESDVK